MGGKSTIVHCYLIALLTQPLVSRDEFIGLAETRHLSSFFEPENGTERAGEEDSLKKPR